MPDQLHGGIVESNHVDITSFLCRSNFLRAINDDVSSETHKCTQHRNSRTKTGKDFNLEFDFFIVDENQIIRRLLSSFKANFHSPTTLQGKKDQYKELGT